MKALDDLDAQMTHANARLHETKNLLNEAKIQIEIMYSFPIQFSLICCHSLISMTKANVKIMKLAITTPSPLMILKL